MSDAYYTIDELAERLKVSRNTIKRAIERKQVLAIQIGAQYRVPGPEAERIFTHGLGLDDPVAVIPHTVPTGRRSRR